jgi:chemotaxis response regulator CheB
MSGAPLTTLRLGSSVGAAVAEAKSADQAGVTSRRPVDRGSRSAEWGSRSVELLAIGASTGGPQALSTVLAALPSTTTAAVVVVQHIAEGFMEGLASWLDDLCPLPVVLGVHGKRAAVGTVTIAPSGQNMMVHERLRLTMHPPAEGQHHVPGIDATFSSVAESYGSSAVGVLLTGMGRDGAIGLKRIRDCGGLTIGQDEATSAVYGMPAAAMSADAVDVQLPLPEISEAIFALLSEDAPACDSQEQS